MNVCLEGEMEVGRFEVVGDGTVIDTKTGLMWVAEDSYKDGKKDGLTWKQAHAYCKRSRAGGHKDWRMPTLGELKELYAAFIGKTVEELEREFWSNDNSPNIDVSVSTRNVPIWIYAWAWSSDQDDSASRAARVGFIAGLIFWSDLSFRYYGLGVLPVRVCKSSLP